LASFQQTDDLISSTTIGRIDELDEIILPEANGADVKRARRLFLQGEKAATWASKFL